MYAHMTNGTIDFLMKLTEKHPTIPFHFMSGTSKDVAYYEGVKKKYFQAGRSFEILVQLGEIQEQGYVVMNHIPVLDEGRPVFEDNFRKRKDEIHHQKGFQAFRLLKPLKGNTYVVFTQWDSANSYEQWKNSKEFQKAHTNIKPPAYFADRPFVNVYQMIEEE
ncbi:antibiotic biosynthesis monooxygenase family protein [Ornithinibacillus halotolerans]|uniref:Heme-degrading monooxygenase HmoB n=1 Tax=Ornithinibacillus halotolerans TaxID=1274357 RepID=A0A916RW86_9BACI|nr:antibiotic biosynthesis monooxygenase [Ornithinibacillus halotolerans]GGA73616.1 heme-degrading monooxygenase HmoB [Ornithinibacillus halotolerans]